jgi:hypothetical protein
MKIALQAAPFLAVLAMPVHALEPIPGSLAYPAQPRSELTKAPTGSSLSHSFRDRSGTEVYETYRITLDISDPEPVITSETRQAGQEIIS